MKRSSRVLVTSTVLLCLGGTAIFYSRPSRSSDEKVKAATVFVSPVKAADLFDVLTYPARVTPKISTTLLSETDGVVAKIIAPLGTRVKKGAPVFEITHNDPVYQFAPMIVRAPVSGVVSSVEVTEGTQITTNQHLAQVTDPRQIRIDIEVPAQDLAYLPQKLTGEFRVTGSNQTLPVRIRGISPVVDPAIGTASCELEVEGKELLSPGLLGFVTFKANRHRGISIPDYAIVYKGNETYARILESGKAKQLAVVLGKKQQGFVEVTQGLTEGVTLIERSSRHVSDGDPVQVESQME